MVFLNKSNLLSFREKIQKAFLKQILIQSGYSCSVTLCHLDKAVLRNGSFPADVVSWMLFFSMT